MKLFTETINENGQRLVCEDAIFDASLMRLKTVDLEEKYISASYDAGECSNPLSLPFEVSEAEFFATITPNDIHIGLTVELDDEVKSPYTNKTGGIYFAVRMTAEEKTHFLCAIISQLFVPNEELVITTSEGDEFDVEVEGDADVEIDETSKTKETKDAASILEEERTLFEEIWKEFKKKTAPNK